MKTKLNKFAVILRKEVMELITPQTLIPLVILFILFSLLGNVMKSAITGSATDTVTVQSDQSGTVQNITVNKNSIIGLIDNDNSDLSNYVKDNLGTQGIMPIVPQSTDPTEAMKELQDYDLNGEKIKIRTLVVINKGFGDQLLSGSNTSVPVDVYSEIDSFGVTAAIAGVSGQNVGNAINSLISQKLFTNYAGDTNVNINYIKSPVSAQSYTFLNNIAQNVDASTVLGYVTSQITFLPLIVFLIIMMATQMLATSMVNEKADKTLETLMTAPVNRLSVLLAKILAASIYAVIYAVIYMFAMNNFSNGMTGGSSGYSQDFIAALKNFGVTFDLSTFIIMGVQLFLSVLCGLAIALIIGMIVDNIKTLQAYIMPLMIVMMIPYFISMFLDVKTLPLWGQIILYIIPFTHTYTAVPNLFTHSYTLIAIGIAYQVIFVAVILTIAVKIFNSDKLFTIGQSIGRKSGKNRNSGLAKLFAKR
ncbi:MAG: ABC transporter permease [Oscillospiraceae bacterium]|nr:ABC transporter permease [Oscillospiraceae bacterium]